MNLSTVKWAQWDKTQSRELLGLFICVCSSLCTILHRTDLIIFPLALQTITTAPMMAIWGKGYILTWNHGLTDAERGEKELGTLCRRRVSGTWGKRPSPGQDCCRRWCGPPPWRLQSATFIHRINISAAVYVRLESARRADTPATSCIAIWIINVLMHEKATVLGLSCGSMSK